jgi:hypothetical protein
MDTSNVGPDLASRTLKPRFLSSKIRQASTMISADRSTYVNNKARLFTACKLAALAAEDPGVVAQQIRIGLRRLKDLCQEHVHVDTHAVVDTLADFGLETKRNPPQRRKIDGLGDVEACTKKSTVEIELLASSVKSYDGGSHLD